MRNDFTLTRAKRSYSADVPDFESPSEPQTAASTLRSVSLALLFLGIAGSAAMQSRHDEGRLHDLARLATLAGIVLFVVSAVRNRRAK